MLRLVEYWNENGSSEISDDVYLQWALAMVQALFFLALAYQYGVNVALPQLGRCKHC